MAHTQIEAVVDACIAAGRHRPGSGFRRYSRRMWRAFNSLYPDFAPTWWQDLTVARSIGGIWFQFPLAGEQPWLGDCVIPWPLKFWKLHKDHFYIHQLQESGLFPFGDASDGNWWLFDTGDSEDPLVHLLELTAWDGTHFNTANGLHSPGVSLSEFFGAGARWTSNGQMM